MFLIEFGKQGSFQGFMIPVDEWGKRERERECVCVRERERERERF